MFRAITVRLIAFVLIIILYIPVLIWLIQEWLNNPFYGHGFLVLIVSAFSFWLKRGRFGLDKPALPGIITLVAGLLTYVLSFSIWGLYFISALSLLIVIFGTIAYFGGMNRAQEFLFPIGFLFFMIPMPFVYQLSYYMQNFATYSSVVLVSLFGVNITTVGNQISLTNSSFIVGVECSGMNSLISLLTIAVLLSFLIMTSSSTWRKVTLVFSALPIAILSNTFRISLILLIANKWGTEAAMSFFHNISSPLLFVLVIVLLLILAKLLRFRLKTLGELSNG